MELDWSRLALAVVWFCLGTVFGCWLRHREITRLKMTILGQNIWLDFYVNLFNRLTERAGTKHDGD